MQKSTNRTMVAALAMSLALLGGCSSDKPEQSAAAGFNPPEDVSAIR